MTRRSIAGQWHYEFIPARGAGHEWRVGDDRDDYMTDFATEREARRHVREHNAAVAAFPPSWRF